MPRQGEAGHVSRRAVLRVAAGATVIGASIAPDQSRAGGGRSIGVIGAGVAGLNVARVFAEAGDVVTVYAANVSPGTTSDVAAAVIFPHLVPPTPPILEAIRLTNEYYASLLSDGVGVYPRTLTLAFDDRAGIEDALLPFAASYPGFRELQPAELPAGYRVGWRADTFFVDSRLFMGYLMSRVASLGASIVVRRFASREEVLRLPHDVIVNCAGLGAGSLFGDAAVYPIKGQLVTVNAIELVDPIIHGESSHIFPRDDSAVLGGTHGEHVADLTISEEVTESIIDSNRRMLPTLSRDQVIAVRAGLRPFREGGPRVEAERIGATLVLHNYGHGGSGWTLAPGCAQQVLRMAQSGGR